MHEVEPNSSEPPPAEPDEPPAEPDEPELPAEPDEPEPPAEPDDGSEADVEEEAAVRRSPPPSQSATGAIEPLPLFAAIGWILAIDLVMILFAIAFAGVGPNGKPDMVAAILCEVAAYGLGLFALLRRYAPQSLIRDFVAWRPVPQPMLVIAPLIGLSAALPAGWILEQIALKWPQEETSHLAKIMESAPPAQQWAIAIGVVVAAPVIEEAIFRGAIFTPLRKTLGAWETIAVTGLLFALVHHDPRQFFPLLLMGLLLGYLRSESGSLLPSMLLHAGFNLVPILAITLGGAAEESAAHAESATGSGDSFLIAFAALVLGVLLFVFHVVAQASPACALARLQDGAEAKSER